MQQRKLSPQVDEPIDDNDAAGSGSGRLKRFSALPPGGSPEPRGVISGTNR